MSPSPRSNLVLTRRPGQAIELDLAGCTDADLSAGITITLVEMRSDRVRIGIRAPLAVRIVRDDAKDTAR